MRSSATRPSAAALAISGLLLGGCAPTARSALTAPATVIPQAPATGGPRPSSTWAVDPAVIGANELGMVPVLMIHEIVPLPKRVYDRTPEAFRALLERLWSEDYRPITARAYVTGHVDIPAGKHPVVITLDDAYTNQAQIDPDGAPKADTALGILEAFGREHPDFHPTATFYVNTAPPAFVDDKVLPWLAAHGYEIGAHTIDHANLHKMSDADVQREIGGNIADIDKSVPGYAVTTMATPFGADPVNRALTHDGTYQGVPYHLAGVMEVDPEPAPSPFAVNFDPFKVPRAGFEDAAIPLDQLAERPEQRYTSDGNPDKISFPAAAVGKLAPAFQERAHPY
ncbi:MAG TPA: polysaccharide deacetylase family protein [Sporichthyaceae bacterium]|nr:polysaccharide deacetylase family protein [Sporichthyaceae bacterium]